MTFACCFRISVGGALESLLKKHSETHIVVGTYAEYPRRSLIAFDMESAGRYEAKLVKLGTDPGLSSPALCPQISPSNIVLVTVVKVRNPFGDI